MPLREPTDQRLYTQINEDAVEPFMTAAQPAKGKGKNFSAAVSMNDKQSMCSDEIEKKLDPEMAGESVVDEDSSEFKHASNEDSKSNTFLG